MSRIRFDALNQALSRTPLKIKEKGKRSAIFGQNVFNGQAMNQYLTNEASGSCWTN